MFQFIRVHFDIARVFCFTFRPPPPAQNTATPGRSAAQNTQPPPPLRPPKKWNKALFHKNQPASNPRTWPSVFPPILEQSASPPLEPAHPRTKTAPWTPDKRHLSWNKAPARTLTPGRSAPLSPRPSPANLEQTPACPLRPPHTQPLRKWNKPGRGRPRPAPDRSPRPTPWTPDPLTQGVNSFTIDPVSWKCVLQGGLGVRSILVRTNDAGQMSARYLLASFFQNSDVSALARCGMALGPKPLADVCALQATLQSRIERSE